MRLRRCAFSRIASKTVSSLSCILFHRHNMFFVIDTAWGTADLLGPPPASSNAASGTQPATSGEKRPAPSVNSYANSFIEYILQVITTHHITWVQQKKFSAFYPTSHHPPLIRFVYVLNLSIIHQTHHFIWVHPFCLSAVYMKKPIYKFFCILFIFILFLLHWMSHLCFCFSFFDEKRPPVKKTTAELVSEYSMYC